MDQVGIVIIGGGVVGCAVARELAESVSDTFLLEALPKLGMCASSRNSGVVHSGLYYASGSLKARHCLRGNALTYEFCSRHGVPHRKTGKLVVAAGPQEEGVLRALLATGEGNGVKGLRVIDRAEIRAREPHVEGFLAIEVPSTGIVAAEELVKAYARVAQDRGAHILTNAKVEKLESASRGIRVRSTLGEVEARCVINCAGLFADDVAAMLGSKMAQHRIYPARGEYFELIRGKQDWVNGLVYPMPYADHAGLGVHLTKTVWGNVLLGPNVRYVEDKTDYERNRESLDNFLIGARVLLPELNERDLVPAYSGIRAKLIPPPERQQSGTARTAADFIIERDPDFPNVIHLMGIESPGLTSAPSIAEQVAEMAREMLN